MFEQGERPASVGANRDGRTLVLNIYLIFDLKHRAEGRSLWIRIVGCY